MRTRAKALLIALGAALTMGSLAVQARDLSVV